MTSLVDIALGGSTPYRDYPPIPERFGRSFKLWVLDDGGGFRLHDRTQDEGEPDIVSRDIAEYGVWEVPETIVLSSAFAASQRALFVDVGSHVGWFSAVAGAWGLDVWAYDANPDALSALVRTWVANRFPGTLTPRPTMIGPHTQWGALPTAEQVIVKIDIEGAERFAIKFFWPLFVDGTITHCLMEVSPCFNDTYPALLGDLFDLGYRGHVMPRKVAEPRPVGDVLAYLRRHCRRLDSVHREAMTEWVQRRHQFDVILHLPDAPWG